MHKPVPSLWKPTRHSAYRVVLQICSAYTTVPSGGLVQFAHRGTEKVWHAGGEEHGKYKQQVVEMLKAGQLVVQMLAAEETITMPDGSRKATFTQETWDMVSSISVCSGKLRHSIPFTILPGFNPNPTAAVLGFWQY